MPRARVGWYRLPSGQLYFGTLPQGAVVVDPPVLGDQAVEPVQDEAPVVADVPGLDLPADPEQVVETPAGGDTGGEDESDSDVDGQAPKPTRPRSRKPKGGQETG